ncbi:hypothetical protein DL762_001425 [Monosporascus cannonballus]|uniref:Uncharacterized protein n=1 Tax=Monosporascus cannonballus TaxID=155416 RepID=A0ABY0HKP5_9PEZI|nr:hypothetical protein DL762_001425 [Monosporascus cannonballus]RYP00962.1 hypothetical protein DL763_000383 [Monosporascus cannonballus]
MSSAYYSDNNGWAYYVDNDGQFQYLLDNAGNSVPYADIVPSASAPKSDSGKSEKSDGSKNSKGSKHSNSSKNSKGSKFSSSSKNSKGSKSDSGLSSNTPAWVGWQCNWCRTVNYTDHQMIPFMDPLTDNNGNILRDENGNIIFDEYPNIPCSGCDGACDPYSTPLSDPQ